MSSRPKHILNLRPMPGALTTAQKLSASGYIVSLLPLTVIKPLLFESIMKAPDNIIVSSASGFHSLSKRYDHLLAKANLYCIGENTAKAAYIYGLRQKAVIYSNSQELIDDKPSLDGTSIYICGKYRTNTIETYLQGKDHKVLECYNTLPHHDNLSRLMRYEVIADIILLTSSYTAELLQRVKYVAPPNSKIVCLSARIAQCLTSFESVYIADEPNEKSILNLIKNL